MKQIGKLPDELLCDPLLRFRPRTKRNNIIVGQCRFHAKTACSDFL